MAKNLTKIDPKTLSVGIIGFTGESGKALTKEVLSKNLFKSTILIGRRNVEFQEEFYKAGIQRVINFDKITEYDDAFKGLDVVYCCLGTTRGKSGVEGFKKVDYEYIVESAKMAKKNGCKQFHLVSSAGADKNSMFLYPKTKGEAEEAIGALSFEQASFYRPKLLVTERTETRTFEKIALVLTKPFQYAAPTLLTTPIDTLAHAMIANTINKPENRPQVEIVDNTHIFELAKLYENNSNKK